MQGNIHYNYLNYEQQKYQQQQTIHDRKRDTGFRGILYRMSFLYLGFRNQSKSNNKEKTFAGIYTVEIADSFTGDSLSVYINDSLLFNSSIGNTAIKFQVKRFAEESTLMIVDSRTDEVTPFNLNPEGSQIAVEKKNGKIFIQEAAND